MNVPIDPPAEIEQNSNTPSNAGLSSPTRNCVPLCVSCSTFSGVTLERNRTYSSVWNRVMFSAVARFALYHPGLQHVQRS